MSKIRSNPNREALRRSYGEAGFHLRPEPQSFGNGGTLTSSVDVLLDELIGKAYSGSGPFPQAVDKGTNPSFGGFVDRSPETLKSQLASSNGVSLSGWVREQMITPSATAYGFMNSSQGVNIWEYSHLVTSRPTVNNPSTWDWTPAFIGALATNRKIILPEGTYIAGNIVPPVGMVIIGAGGESAKTTLVIKTGASGYFTPNTNSGHYTGVIVSGVAISSQDNNSAFWKQSSNSNYTAYALFDDVDIYRNVKIAFDGFFIFTEWHKCRDGYNGSVSAAHSFISSQPAAMGQPNQTNLCQVNSCRIFNSVGSPAVDIAYGARWDFNHTDFEGCTSVAIRARGIYGGKITGGWLENCSGAYVLDIDTSVGTNSHGSRTWELSHVFVNLTNSSGIFAHVGASSILYIDHTQFSVVPVGCVIFSSAGGGRCFVRDGVEVISGSSTTFFNQTQIEPPVFPNNNVLPFGEYNVKSAYFTGSGLSMSDGASFMDPINTTMRLTLNTIANLSYFTIPAKVLPFLLGKTVRIKAVGSFVTATGADAMFVRAWDNVVTPNGSNHSASKQIVSSTSTTLNSVYVDLKVGASSTSFALGFYAGGGAGGAVFVVESLTMQIDP